MGLILGGLTWKACLWETVTWVRIPLSPPNSQFRKQSRTIKTREGNFFGDKLLQINLLLEFNHMSLKIKSVLFLAIILSIPKTHARAPEDFLTSTLEQAYKEKKYVILHFYASWCFMCKAQKKILDKVMIEDQDLRKVVTLVVPYDDALKLRAEFSNPSQSTLIIMKEGKEIARSSRITDKDELVKFLKKNIPLE